MNTLLRLSKPFQVLVLKFWTLQPQSSVNLPLHNTPSNLNQCLSFLYHHFRNHPYPFRQTILISYFLAEQYISNMLQCKWEKIPLFHVIPKCAICDRSFASQTQLSQHLESLPHKNKLKAQL